MAFGIKIRLKQGLFQYKTSSNRQIVRAAHRATNQYTFLAGANRNKTPNLH